MTALDATLPALREALEHPAVWTPENEAFAEPAFRQALQAGQSATPEARSAALAALAGCLSTAEPYQAARLALLMGTFVEYGAHPGPAAPALLDRLAAVCRSPGPDAARHARSVRFLGLAAMAMLCRDRELRQHARSAGLPAAVADVPIAEAGFVAEVLAMVDDLPLLVLHLERPEGFRVRVDAVSNVFHLTTLLAAAVPAWCDGDPVDPAVAAAARGEHPPTAGMHDHARFHLFDHSGVDRHPGSTLWGEAQAASIPVFEGERIVLVGAPLFGSRTWDAGFFPYLHEALRSAVRMEGPVTPEERERWLERLRAWLAARS
ncbi:MAG: hypothetical protein H6737_12095 [Alphaproteobacteria bacterium]|nr:hypothetical protein [Alphaproteobacteria bacterium]